MPQGISQDQEGDTKLVGIINGNALEYWDAESLQVAVARAKLLSRAREVESGGRRTCGVCGAQFEPTPAQARYPKPVQTCPACLAAGRKAKGVRRGGGTATCRVCGAQFRQERRDQNRCRACIDAAPKHGWRQQKRRTA